MKKMMLLIALFAFGAVFLGLKAGLAQTSITVSLAAKHLIYDPDLDRLIASVPSGTLLPDGGIVAINPKTGAITATLDIPGGPDVLAISHDDHYLYTGLDNAPDVDRINLRSWKSDLQFPLGASPDYQTPDYAIGIAVSPTNPRTIAVSLALGPEISAMADGIAIYDDGVSRPLRTLYYGYPNYQSLAFGATEATLYAENVASSAEDFGVLNVTAQGVKIGTDIPNFMVGNLIYRPETQRLYSSYGLVSDPVTLERKGQFFAPYFYTSPIIVRIMDGAPDQSYGRFFALTIGATTTPTDATVISYDLNTYRPTGLFTIPNANSGGGVNSLVLCGSDRLAFQNMSGQIFIVTGLDFAGLQSVAVLPHGPLHPGAAQAVVTLTRPAPPGGAPVLLTSSIFGLDYAFPMTVPAGSRSAAFPLTIPPVAASTIGALTAQYGLQTTGVRASILSDTGTPALPDNIKTLYALTSSFTYDSQVHRVFATVPSADAQHGNSVLCINPMTAKIESALDAGSEPDVIKASSNGKYLYLGLQGASSVSRINVADGREDLRFFLGNDPRDGPYQIDSLAPVPGEPRSVAVGRSDEYSTGTFVGPIVYDDATPRLQVPSQFLYIDSIVFGADAAHLYGVDSQTSDAGFSRYSVDQSGVTLIDDTPYFVNAWEIKYDSGRMFTAGGLVFDPLTNTTIATLPLDLSGYYESSFVTDVVHGRAYYLVTDLFSRTSVLKIFDTSSYTLTNQYTLPSNFMNPGLDSIPGGYGDLILCGQDQLAFENADGQMAFINVAPPVLSSLTGGTRIVHGGSALQLTVAMTNVADANGLSVALSSSNSAVAPIASSTVVPSNQTVSTVTITTARVATPTSVVITARYGMETRRFRFILTP